VLDQFNSQAMTMKSSNLIAVAIFRSRAAAQKAKSVLDQAGIESEIRSDPTNMHWVPTQGKHFAESNASQLMVRAEDIDEAGEVLRKGHQPSD
jgi:hypothetical protein